MALALPCARCMACIVELRGTADAHLREIVADGLPRLVRALGAQDRELPRFVTCDTN